MQTDLPEPVVPAISIWGIFLISPITLWPVISLPTQKLILDLLSPNSGESIRSRMGTVSETLLGASMPTANLSGIMVIRTLAAPKDKAISSDKLLTRENLVPRFNCSSYRVTLGPRVISTKVASTPKLFSVSTSRAEFSASSWL